MAQTFPFDVQTGVPHFQSSFRLGSDLLMTARSCFIRSPRQSVNLAICSSMRPDGFSGISTPPENNLRRSFRRPGAGRGQPPLAVDRHIDWPYDSGTYAAQGIQLHVYRAGSGPARVELAPLTHRRRRPPASLPSSDSRRIWRIEENVSGGFITSHKVHRSNRRGPG